jgi:hypothetical protein
LLARPKGAACSAFKPLVQNANQHKPVFPPPLLRSEEMMDIPSSNEPSSVLFEFVVDG